MHITGTDRSHQCDDFIGANIILIIQAALLDVGKTLEGIACALILRLSRREIDIWSLKFLNIPSDLRFFQTESFSIGRCKELLRLIAGIVKSGKTEKHIFSVW